MFVAFSLHFQYACRKACSIKHHYICISEDFFDNDFFCCSVLWKLLLKNGTVNSVLVKVAQRTQPKKLAAFMRKMADYIIFTLPEQLDNVSCSTVVIILVM